MENLALEVSSKAQETQFKQIFDLIDLNRSGEVNIDEIEHLPEFIEFNPTRETLLKLIVITDVDKEGSLMFEEFCELLLLIPHTEKTGSVDIDLEKWKETFNAFDKQNIGKINLDTTEKIVNRIQKRFIDITVLRKVFLIIDSGADGEIEFNELCKLLIFLPPAVNPDIEFRRAFKEYDANNSGKIEYDDMQTLLERCGAVISDEDLLALSKWADRTFEDIEFDEEEIIELWRSLIFVVGDILPNETSLTLQPEESWNIVRISKNCCSIS